MDETLNYQQLQIGKVTDCLLKAVRALEQCKDYYFAAIEARDGEGLADGEWTETVEGYFEPVSKLIERQLQRQLWDWSRERPTKNTI